MRTGTRRSVRKVSQNGEEPLIRGIGVLAHGFLRLHCDDTGRDRLVAFSCYLEPKTIRSPRKEEV